MFYKIHTAVIAIIIGMLLLASLFVCAESPYSKLVWLSAIMLVTGCVAFGLMTVCLHDKPDSSFPVSTTAAVVTFYYVVFVAILAVPPIFSMDIPFKYYALIHAVGFGFWCIMLVVYRMWVRLVYEQDTAKFAAMEFRKTCRASLLRVIDTMRKSNIDDNALVTALSRLNGQFRYCYVTSKGALDIEAKIMSNLNELNVAVCAKDKAKMCSIVKELESELIEKQCKNDGHRETKDDIQQVKENGIPQSIDEILVLERLDEILESVILSPGHLCNRLHDTVLLECDQYVVHGTVLKHRKINHGDEQQNVQLPVSLNIN